MSFVLFPGGQEVAIQVHVVLIESPQPGHAERIENVDEHEGRIVRNRRKVLEQAQLDRRTSERLDAVKAGRVKQYPPWRFRAEPGDVDRQVFAGRPPGRQRKRLESSALCHGCLPKPIARRPVVSGKVWGLDHQVSRGSKAPSHPQYQRPNSVQDQNRQDPTAQPLQISHSPPPYAIHDNGPSPVPYGS